MNDLREWLVSKIDGSEETRGEDSLISGFIADIDSQDAELAERRDVAARWHTAAAPYATPMALYEALRAMSSPSEMGTIPDAEREKVMEAHRLFESIVESAGTTPFEIRKKIMTAHMLAESIVERATVATPRTDAAEVTMLRLDGDADVVVAAFFARQLERELIAARSATAALPVEEGAIREALKWCRGAASNDRWSEENLRHQIITRADEALNRSYTR